MLTLASQKHSEAMALIQSMPLNRPADLSGLRRALMLLEEASLLADDVQSYTTTEAFDGALTELEQQRAMLAKAIRQLEHGRRPA